MEELDLKEIFNMFWLRKDRVILIVLIFVILGGLYSYLYVKPIYKAYTTLVLATAENNSSSSDTITTADISINNNLVATYSELIRSKSVVRQVIDNLDIDRTEGSVKANVSVNAVKGTQLIQINVTDSNPNTAKVIANEVAKVFSSKVGEIYKMNNIHVVDAAETPTTPYNINHLKDFGMAALAGLVVAAIYVIIANMIDTTVKTKEDVEKKLGLTVLVNIPINNFDELTKTGKGGKR